MSCFTPDTTDRYAVVSQSTSEAGPADVTFWPNHMAVIDLMTRHANCCFHFSQGFSVWHRRTATSAWKLITDTTAR